MLYKEKQNNTNVVIIANNSCGLYLFRKELISELLAQGNTITALTPFDNNIKELQGLGIKLINTPINRRGISPIDDLKLYKSYSKLLKEISPDLVVTYTVKPNIYGGFFCRLLKIPYVINITGLGTAFQNDGMLKKLVTMMYKVSLRKAKVVFFENEENRQIFIDLKIVKKEQTYLLNGAGVNLEHYNIAEYPTDTECTRFLFIGRVMQEKGVDELFEAMKKLQEKGVNCTLDVLGGYEEDYAEKIKEYEAEGWLKYHGYQKDVRSFIEKAHCFVLPSWHEGMANTNLECAAMGRPVITSNIHGCKEAVVDGVSGFLCERKDAGSLFEVMRKFIKLTYEERKALGEAGRAHMEEVFDKRKVVEETINAIKEQISLFRGGRDG